MKNLLVIGTLLAGMLATAAPAHAHGMQWGYGGLGSVYGGLTVSRPYAMGRIPTPPYFALHPPVYYKAPVARTYGYSPFAYPGSVRTPDVQAAPEVVENPHVQPKAKADKDQVDATEANFVQARPKPATIMNPFVADAQLARD